MTNPTEGAMPPLPEHKGIIYLGEYQLPNRAFTADQLHAYAAQLLARVAELQEDAARWRRLVNASELPFPTAAIADDPENDARMVYGRKRLEALIDLMDEIPNTYEEQQP